MKVLGRFMVDFHKSSELFFADEENFIIVWLGVDVHLVWILKRGKIDKALAFRTPFPTYIGVDDINLGEA